MIEKLRMWFIESVIAARPASCAALEATNAVFVALACSCCAWAARQASRQAGWNQKKGASKWVTRLPTERLATACWAFIVAKTTGWEPASLLDFRPLQRSDRLMLSTDHPQAESDAMEQGLTNSFQRPERVNPGSPGCILDGRTANRGSASFEVKVH
jgi:hypothetical protein